MAPRVQARWKGRVASKGSQWALVSKREKTSRHPAGRQGNRHLFQSPRNHHLAIRERQMSPKVCCKYRRNGSCENPIAAKKMKKMNWKRCLTEQPWSMTREISNPHSAAA